MKFISIIFLLLTAPLAFSQSGYLGSLNAFEFKIGLAPSITRSEVLTTPTKQTARLRIVNLKYELNYSRTINRNSELFIGYQFIPMKGNLKDITVDNLVDNSYLKILESPKLTSHGFNLGYRIFRKGSLAPIGKFLFFGVNYLKTTVDTYTDIIVGRNNEYSGSFDSFSLTETASVQIYDTANTLYDKSVSSFNLRFGFGRNYPITDNLIITTNFSVPFLRYFNFGDSRGVYLIYNPKSIDYTEGRYLDNIEGLLANTLKQYSGVSLDIGVKFHF
ncbi:hypothetical protein [Crocinitomix catalasitica]|uniref:hypothetical protein n=1 Tax=Crocinitomix catalasitica TaxID=184607 RepID=UPI000482A03D|nr:hypothetical protein [Crocinitomix catalasitica]